MKAQKSLDQALVDVCKQLQQILLQWDLQLVASAASRKPVLTPAWQCLMLHEIQQNKHQTQRH